MPPPKDKKKEKESKISRPSKTREVKSREQKTCSKEKLSREKLSKEKLSKERVPKKDKKTTETAEQKTVDSPNNTKHSSPAVKKTPETRTSTPEKSANEPTVDPTDAAFIYYAQNRTPIMYYGPWGGDMIYEVNMNATGIVQDSRKVDNLLSPGGTLTTNNGMPYLIVDRLGKTSYKVQNSISKNTYFMKIQSSRMPYFGPNLQRYLKILDAAHKNPEIASHFPRIVESDSLPSPEVTLLVTHLLGPNLENFRQNGGEFDAPTAFRMCIESLKAIHDLHAAGFTHRDVQPKNFSIGVGDKSNTLFMNSFDYAQEYPPVGSASYKWNMTKFPWMNLKYVPRAFHIKDTYKSCDDIESWIYMCYDFFDSRALPWSQADLCERDIYMKKKLFFEGFYDGRLSNVPENLKIIRELKKQDLNPYFLDYATYFYALKMIAKDMGIKLNPKLIFGFRTQRETQKNSSEATKSAATELLSKNLPTIVNLAPEPLPASQPTRDADGPYYSLHGLPKPSITAQMPLSAQAGRRAESKASGSSSSSSEESHETRSTDKKR